MLSSTIIEIDGVFLGAAILLGQQGARRFYATHASVRILHDVVLPDLGSLRRKVISQFRSQGGWRHA